MERSNIFELKTKQNLIEKTHLDRASFSWFRDWGKTGTKCFYYKINGLLCEAMRISADAMVSTGLSALGYTYINLGKRQLQQPMILQ